MLPASAMTQSHARMSDTSGLLQKAAAYGRWSLIAIFAALCLVIAQPGASEFHCENGEVAVADLGGGVVMRTCLWEKEPGIMARTGPMELIKNEILILEARTNLDGQLHGLYSSWDDAGRLMEQGQFRKGLKQGQWIYADGNGLSRVFYYRAGVPLGL